jgi:cytochrome P450
MDGGTSVDFDPRTPAAIVDPYAALKPLQDAAPVYWSDRLGAWCVTRYADIRAAFRDRRLSADRIRPFIAQAAPGLRDTVGPLGDHLEHWAVFTDPPDHTRLRGLMNKAFTARAVESLRPNIAAIVDELLDGVEADLSARGSREFDFTAAVAYPLPATVIADMLGVPRADVDRLKDWSDRLAKFVLTSRADPDRYRLAAEGVAEMEVYFHDFLDHPPPGGHTGVTAGLIDARDAGDRLTPDELVANCVLLLFAGHETTTQLLANGLLALLRNPDQMADLRANLDDVGLVQNAVEEMLRFDGPALSSVRVAAEDFDWHGARLRRGDRVFLFQCAGNRDPRAFAAPDRFDIRRDDAKNNIGFGYGIHFCLGAPLARLEAEVAFPRILHRFPGLALADPDPPWSDSILTRGMLRLLVRA